ITQNIKKGNKILAPAWMGIMFPGLVYPYAETIPHDEDIMWAIIEADPEGDGAPPLPAGIIGEMKPVFSSGSLTVYSSLDGLPAASLPAAGA
ncbi:MAG: hypothetical protein M0Z75_05225, partial [Nitrospiraceae bacterium]|nr:hypothetical protein [Nitrospiraceae bacterium]